MILVDLKFSHEKRCDLPLTLFLSCHLENQICRIDMRSLLKSGRHVSRRPAGGHTGAAAVTRPHGLATPGPRAPGRPALTAQAMPTHGGSWPS